MKVEIIVSRNGLPKKGEVKDYPERYALDLVQKGLVKIVDGKQPQKSVKVKTDKKET